MYGEYQAWMGAMEGNVPMTRVGGRSVTGGSYPAQIFGRLYNAVLDQMEPEPFAEPPDRRGTGTLRLDRNIDLDGYSTTPTRRRRTTTRTPSRSAPATTAAPAPTTTVAPEPPSDPGNGNGNGNGGGDGGTSDTTPSGDFEEMNG